MVLKDDNGCSLATGGEPKKCVRESGAKCGAGGGVTGLVVVAPNKISNKARKDERTSDVVRIGEYVINHWLIWYSSIVLLLIIFFGDAGPYGGMKPNVELTGRGTES